MNEQQADFVVLCRELRLLGATEVRWGVNSARFVGRAVPVTAPRLEEPPPPPEETQPLTEEQAIEAQYARELGRAAPTKRL